MTETGNRIAVAGVAPFVECMKKYVKNPDDVAACRAAGVAGVCDQDCGIYRRAADEAARPVVDVLDPLSESTWEAARTGAGYDI